MLRTKKTPLVIGLTQTQVLTDSMVIAVSTLNHCDTLALDKECDPIDGSEAEVYLFRGRCVFIDVYKVDDKISASGATSLADIDLRRTYRAINSVATGRIPSLFCDLGEC